MVMKCTFDAVNAKFVCKNPETHAMLFKNEYINSVCAFPPDGLLVSASGTDLIVVRNWKVTTYIQDLNFGNDQKEWQAMLPFFDIDKFPFIVSSGYVNYNFINVKSGQMQTLAHGSAANVQGQQAFCFDKQDNIWMMHFCSRNFNEQNSYEFNWYCFNFKEDLLQILKKYGRLPYETIAESLKESQQLRE